MLSCFVWTRGLWVFSLAACVFMSCFAHVWWFVLPAMCLCFCFVWAHGLCLSFLCVMCSHANCLDPTHLITWLLVYFPQLLSLVTLLICSLYNLLVFAVLFVIVPSPVVSCSCLAFSCLALSCLPDCFPSQGSFVCLFVLFYFWLIKPILLHNWVLASSLHPNPDSMWAQRGKQM